MSGLEKEDRQTLLNDMEDSGSNDEGEEYQLTTQLESAKNKMSSSSRTRRKVRYQRPGAECSCSGRALIIVLVIFLVGCALGTLGYFIFQLKDDIGTIQTRVKTLESELQTSTEQASTVNTLQVNIEQLLKLPAQISNINRQIGYLNSTNSQLQAKVKAARDEIKALPTISIEGLQQSTAQIGSTMQSVQGLQGQHAEQIDTLTSSLNQLQASLTELQGEVSKQHQTDSEPTLKDGASDPTAATTDVKKAIQSLQQGQEDVSLELVKLNTTVASIQLWKQDLVPRIRTLEAADHSSDATDGSLTEKLTQLQSQVNTLLSSVYSQTPPVESGGQTHNPIASDTPKDWRQEIESQIQTLQKRIDGLNPQDLNNNLLNVNTTRGIQHQIERALGVFKTENLKSVDEMWPKLYQQHSDITDIQQEVDDLQARVQDLENKEGKTTPPPASSKLSSAGSSAAATTVEPSTTADLQPITIKGISSVEELTIKFFIMDNNSDDFLTYQELKDFLGPNAPPEDQFMRYDRDKDGKLDLAEMTTALGFQ